MILNLDRLLLPQRLSAIKSVELVWEFEPFPWPSRPDMKRVPGLFTGLEYFHQFLDQLPGMFPNLRFLYIALQGNLCPWKRTEAGIRVDWGRRTEIWEEHIMQPIDNMVRRLAPQVQECFIALPSVEYSIRMRVAREQAGVLVEQVHLGAQRERHWRRVNNSTNLGGYWVMLGKREHKIQDLGCCGCFGTGGNYMPAEDEVLYVPLGLWYLP